MGYPVSGWEAAFFPLVIALQLATVGGMALGLAALNVHFKDVKDIVANLLALLFYLTPVIYTLDGVHFPDDRWAQILGTVVTTLVRWCNPFTPFIEATQDLVFRGTWPEAGLWLHMGAWTLASWMLGTWVFDRLRDSLVEAVWARRSAPTASPSSIDGWRPATICGPSRAPCSTVASRPG
jgi:ABC-type polysaccharide/polyol phosphate export permease